MANRGLLLCLVVLLIVNCECRRGGGFSSRSRGGSSSRGGGGWSIFGGRSSSSSSSRHAGSSSSSGSSSNRWSSSSGSSASTSGGSGSSPSSGSSWSSYGNQKPSYPTGGGSSRLSGSGSNHGYPSSPGLSGSGGGGGYSPSSGSGNQQHTYPSGGRLSGSGSNHGYPSSATGLSGSGSVNNYSPSRGGTSSGNQMHNYPFSGGSSGNNNYQGSGSYPPSSTGISGSGSNHGYPPSHTGMSGSGSSSFGGVYTPPRSSVPGNQQHTYLSGSSTNYKPATGTGHHPSNTYVTNNNYHYNQPSHGYGGGYHTYNHPHYYSAPQHVYVTEYRNSGSRYSDLLTGLTLYNMGRSHSHYHDHYYHDDYYNRRYNTAGSYSNNYYTAPKETAVCKLKIKNDNSIETLKIPCEIVSTFTKDAKKVSPQNTTNVTVCVTESTVVKNQLSNIDSQSSIPKSNVVNNTLLPQNTTTSVTSDHNVGKTNENATELADLSVNTTLINSASDSGINNVTNDVLKSNMTASTNGTINNTANENVTVTEASSATSNQTIVVNDKNDALLVQPIKSINSTDTKGSLSPANKSSSSVVKVVNITKCTTTVNSTDPMTVKGPTVDPSGMECIVEIQTKDSLLQNKVDCNTLMKYAKMPEPKKEESSLMPSRSTLKSWLKSPPWWMSMFIAA